MRKLKILSYDREHDVLYAQFDDHDVCSKWVAKKDLSELYNIENVEDPSESLIIYDFKKHVTVQMLLDYLPAFDWKDFYGRLKMHDIHWSLHDYSDQYVDILQHRAQVRFLMEKFTSQLMARAFTHDDSKFSKEEFPAYDACIPLLKEVDYDSDEYKAILSEMKPALEHHYKNNRHHPEYFEDQVKDDKDSPVNYMNLFDLIEMYIDWKAASMRQINGAFEKSIWRGCSKYEISTQLEKIFENTIRELGE